MALFACSRCNNSRSRTKGALCPVCYLIMCLADEHATGQHAGDDWNASCKLCRAEHPRYRAIPPVTVEANKVTFNRPGRYQISPIDHASCDHERTPTARARCRAARRRGTVLPG